LNGGFGDVDAAQVRPPLTAYLQWDGFREHLNDLTLAGWEDSAPKPVMDTARDHLRASLAAAGRACPYDLEPTSAEEAVECR
jgi:hypothetical protein